MIFFSPQKYAVRQLVLRLKWQEFLGYKPYSQAFTNNKMIAYYDWWGEKAANEWFTVFIEDRFPELDKKVNFFSVFGRNRYIYKPCDGKKIFFTAENIDPKNYCINVADLSIGFKENKEKNYYQFPAWLLYLIPPRANEKEIRKIINDINKYRDDIVRRKEAVIIARHDLMGTRKMICDSVSSVMNIRYGGKWRNNTKELWETYNDDKLAYMRNFKFNICPENSNGEHYVTEKVFQSFQAGTIPIYYGSNNSPEPSVINRDAIVFWDYESNNETNVDLIKRLLNSDKTYLDWRIVKSSATLRVKRLQ